ncbi:hypothetical protein FRC12_001121 [Ceratobasidium sp. 428]|nr:hypothetical protein FRC12_001121 [Ceratobasidium sp. 428]
MATTSTYRRSNRPRRPPPPTFTPAPPSKEYFALSQIPSNQLSTPQDDLSLPRKLLVLDLNGTLVLRSPREFGAMRTVMARPYAKTFRNYVFHEGSQLDVMVWSSAQPHSVDSMLDVFFGSDRHRLAGIWARDTLGLAAENYSQKVQTVKDLNIVWDAPEGLPPPVKVVPPPPMAVLTDDPSLLPGYDPAKPMPALKTKIYTSTQLTPVSNTPGASEEGQDRTTYWSVPEVQPDDPIPGLTGANSADIAPTPPGMYSALNTLLLDDSPLKAHLQPYNNLTLPEYTADLRARDVRRRDALEEVAMSAMNEGAADENVENGNAEQSSLDVGSSKQHYFKTLRAAPFDKTLIAVIGVLSAIRHESSIVGWMRAGGMRPSLEEMARVSALVEEEQEEVDEELSGEVSAGNAEDRPPSKRTSSPWIEGEQASPKRPRPDPGAMEVEDISTILDEPTAVVQEDRDQTTFNLAPPASEASSKPAEQLQPPTHVELPTTALAPGFTPMPVSTSESTSGDALLADASKDTTLSPQISSPILVQNTPNHKPTRRGRRRGRSKPFYPITHPLSANDSYPFFTDGNSDEKLWFQDREIYTYWVRRGLLALKDCRIEPEAGVEGT